MPPPPGLRPFIQRLLAAFAARLTGEWQSIRDAAKEDSQAFVEAAQSDLARWSGLLAAGALSRQDFEWLVRARQDQAYMDALTRAGATRAQVDGIRALLVESVVLTALAYFR